MYFVCTHVCMLLAEHMAHADPAAPLKFSRNVVVVEIRGQATPRLTLIDLPGLVSVQKDEASQEVVKMVQDLSETYMR